MKKTLYLFTYKFPFGNSSEAPFLQPELEHLSRVFKEIIIVPYDPDLKEPIITKKYSVDLSLKKFQNPNKARRFSALLNREILWEFIKHCLRFQTNIVRQEWSALSAAAEIAEWVAEKKIDSASSVFYTYFFSDITIGLALAKDNGSRVPLVSRAHGGDLYAERKIYRHFSFREYALGRIDQVFLISEDGYKYMCSAYPNLTAKFSIARLGVCEQGFTTQYSQKDRHASIVSCAYLKPVKRIDLLCDAIKEFSDLNENLVVNWNHFGGGDAEEFKKITNKISGFSSNIKTKLWGNVSNTAVMDFYKNNEVDFFISVSSSEGIPVSMMEALSCGIPIVSTNVGGVKELVTNETGLLFPQDATPKQIAKSMTNFILGKQHISKRFSAKQMWKKYFSSAENYSEFAKKMTAF